MLGLLLAAQVVAAPAVDLSKFATPDQAAAAAVQAATAAMPPVCTDPPKADTPGGSAGAAAACTQRADSSRPASVLPSVATTASDGTFSGTWPGTFASPPTTAMASAKTVSDPYTCQIAVATVSGYSGKCWKQTQVIALPTTVTALLGLQLTAAAPSPAGIMVQVVGRQ